MKVSIQNLPVIEHIYYNECTCSLTGGVIPMERRKIKKISSSIAVSLSSVRGTIGVGTHTKENKTYCILDKNKLLYQRQITKGCIVSDRSQAKHNELTT